MEELHNFRKQWNIEFSVIFSIYPRKINFALSAYKIQHTIILDLTFKWYQNSDRYEIFHKSHFSPWVCSSSYVMTDFITLHPCIWYMKTKCLLHGRETSMEHHMIPHMADKYLSDCQDEAFKWIIYVYDTWKLCASDRAENTG